VSDDAIAPTIEGIDRATALDRLAAAVPANVRRVCETLVAAGFQAVAVGGAVRDAILGRAPGDWDVATAAHPDDVIRLFPHTIPTGLQHGTVTIVTGRGLESHVEVTTFRGEGMYTDGRRPDSVLFGVPLTDDLARRDLRVNAMAYDPATRELIDPYGGFDDLVAGRLRAVGPTRDVYTDAVARFTEDGLRVMRAVRFAAQLELPLDADTERGIGPALPSLAKVSRERVCEELRKILAAREPSRALIPAWRSGILDSILAELVAGWEPWLALAPRSLDVFVENWATGIDATQEPSRLGAMLAELARPDHAGRRLDRAAHKRAGDVLRRLKFSNEEITTAATLVGTAPALAVPAWTETQARRLLADATRAHAPAAAAMWRGKGALELADLGELILARGDALAASELSVTGNDLMTELGMAPGRALGDTLKQLLERVLEDPARNTRDQLLELAREVTPS